MAALNEKDWRELFRLRRAVSRAEQCLAEIDRGILLAEGLCTSDLDILERLSRKGSRPVNGLGRRVGLTSGSMTTAVQRLARRGLVTTRRDVEDKRVVFVSSTPEGRKVAEKFGRKRGKVLSEVFSEWSPREIGLLTNLLKRLRKCADHEEPAKVGK